MVLIVYIYIVYRGYGEAPSFHPSSHEQRASSNEDIEKHILLQRNLTWTGVLNTFAVLFYV
uniref:Uncharacterized protein n=1 Tax=Utricularia reniformis TaxID=192314 RepID=A0A1Y0AZU2_9LAMI|nr:hypothetical protein AEK19_MT0439 [Utricularia reniformis]ART30702.1 hypothetical protein AEK19_MT0439 [Utricularia reniformis]